MNTITIESNIKEFYNLGDMFKRDSNNYYILTESTDSRGCNIISIHSGRQAFNVRTRLSINNQESLDKYLKEYGFTKLPKGTKITLSCNE